MEEKKKSAKDRPRAVTGKGKNKAGTIYPIPKGESGNPKGRPKGALSYSTIIKNALDVEVKQRDGTVLTQKELIIRRYIAAALSQEATLDEMQKAIRTTAAFLGEDPGTKLTVEGEITAREKMPESYEFIITPPGEADEG